MRTLIAILLLLPMLAMGGQTVITGGSRKVFSAPPTTCPVVPSSPAPVLFYSLSGDTSSTSGCVPSSSTVIYDASGGGNNATWGGTPAGTSFWYDVATNALPYAGHFNNSNHATFTNPLTLTDFTLTMWVTPESFPAMLLNKVGCIDGDYVYMQTSTLIRVNMSRNEYPFTVPSMTTGTSYFLAVSRTGSTDTHVYLNAVESTTGNLTNAGETLTLKYISNYCDISLQGKMNYLQIYNSGLTSAQISALYSSQAELIYPVLRELHTPEFAWNFERDDLRWKQKQLAQI